MGYKVEKRDGSRPWTVVNKRDGSVVATTFIKEDAENIARNKEASEHKDTGLDTAEVQAAGAAKSQVKAGVSDEDGNTRPATQEELDEQREAETTDEEVVPANNLAAENDPDPEVQDQAPLERPANTETVKRADVKEAQPDVPPEHTGDAEKEASEDPTEATDNEDVPADEPELGEIAEKAKAADPNANEEHDTQAEHVTEEPKAAAEENTTARLEDSEAESSDNGATEAVPEK